jgi:hypothetical protein
MKAPESELERAKIMRNVAYDLEDLLRRRLEETDVSDVECREHFGECVVCKVGRRFYDIGKSVAEGFWEYCEEEGLSEEECEEAYWDAYEDELGRINEENVIEVKASIATPTLEVRVEPLECDGDGCIVGATVEVRFKEVAQLGDEQYRRYWLGRVAEVVATLLREL